MSLAVGRAYSSTQRFFVRAISWCGRVDCRTRPWPTRRTSGVCTPTSVSCPSTGSQVRQSSPLPLSCDDPPDHCPDVDVMWGTTEYAEEVRQCVEVGRKPRNYPAGGVRVTTLYQALPRNHPSRCLLTVVCCASRGFCSRRVTTGPSGRGPSTGLRRCRGWAAASSAWSPGTTEPKAHSNTCTRTQENRKPPRKRDVIGGGQCLR